MASKNFMRDWIAQNAEFVMDYGQLVFMAIILIGIFLIYRIGRNRRFLVPGSILGWFGALLCLALILISSLAIYGLQIEKSTTGKVLDQFEYMVDAKAPELTFRFVSDNEPGKLDNYEGKVVLLNFWATWCQPCIKEMPELIRLKDQYASKGLEVLLLSDESREKLLNFKKIEVGGLNSVYNQQIEWISMNLGTARPLTLIIDRKGVIRSYHTGARKYDFLVSEIEPFL